MKRPMGDMIADIGTRTPELDYTGATIILGFWDILWLLLGQEIKMPIISTTIRFGASYRAFNLNAPARR